MPDADRQKAPDQPIHGASTSAPQPAADASCAAVQGPDASSHVGNLQRMPDAELNGLLHELRDVLMASPS